MDRKIYRNRILIVLAVFAVAVAGAAFLNLQMDDELHYGFYEYTGYPENANFDGGVVTVDQTMGLSKGDTIAVIPAMHIDAGTYILDAEHQNEHDFEAVVYDGDDVIETLILPSSETKTRCSFNVPDNLYNMSIVYTYNGQGTVTVKQSTLYAPNLFYTDTIVFAVFMILAAGIIAIILIKKGITTINKKEAIFWSTWFLFVIIVNYPYYRPLWQMSPDGAFHLARIEGIFNEIKHGQFPVVLYTDALSGRGTVAALYPQLFLYIPALLRMLRVSLGGAVRLFFILINIATCATAYFSAKLITRNRYLSLIAMIMYCLLPYRIITMTYRSAYGETQAFIFLPLVIAGLYELIAGERRNWWVLAVGISGVIQSHVISTMNTLIVCMVFGAAFLWVLIKEGRIKQVLYVPVSALFLNLWYIYSFIRYYLSDVDISGQMISQDFSTDAMFVSRIFQLLAGNETENVYTGIGPGLGLLVLLFVSGCIYFRKREKYDTKDRFAFLLIIVGAVYIWMGLKEFPWLTLQKIEPIGYLSRMVKFPMRLGVISQSLILFGGIMTIQRDKWLMSYKKKLLLAVLLLITLQGYLLCDTFLQKEYISMSRTGNRFEPNAADQFSYDYVPSGYWEEDFPNGPESPGADIKTYDHAYTHTVLAYTSGTDTYVDIPLLYYIGYEAVTEAGKQLGTEKGDRANLRIELPAANELTTVNIDFHTPAKWYVVYAISLVSWMILAIIAALDLRCRYRAE